MDVGAFAVIGFVLRYGTAVFPLEGRMLAGRVPECDIYLDAVSVSRKHASFTAYEDYVLVEDLGSRNGVYVNGTRLVEAVRIRVGDRVVLGSAVLVLALGERRTATMGLPRASAAPAAPTYRQSEAFPIFLDACARALSMGHVSEAAAGLQHLFRVLMEAAAITDADPIDPQVIGTATSYLLDVAERTSDGAWIDRVFDLRRATSQPFDTIMLRRALGLLGRTEGATGEGIRRYVAWVQSSPVGALERIALRRIRDALGHLPGEGSDPPGA